MFGLVFTIFSPSQQPCDVCWVEKQLTSLRHSESSRQDRSNDGWEGWLNPLVMDGVTLAFLEQDKNLGVVLMGPALWLEKQLGMMARSIF